MPARRSQPRKTSGGKRRDAAPPTRPKRAKPVRRPAAQATETRSGEEAGERLQKVLASAGVASRRECEQLILEGRVEVNRRVVTELGTRVDPQRQEIRVDGEALARPKLVYFAVNKPTGVVSTARDPAGRPRVTDLMPPNAPRVFCVGRLDIASEGLILVTNDGDLANGLTHPRHGVEKTYQVKVAGLVENAVLAQLHRGIHLAEGFAHVKHVRIKSRQKRSTILEMILDEGRNREVRRLLARVGHKVQQLRRVAVGPVRLADLPTGAVRPLTSQEVRALHEAVAQGSEPGEGNVKQGKPRPSRRRSPMSGKPAAKRKQDDGRTVIG